MTTRRRKKSAASLLKSANALATSAKKALARGACAVARSTIDRAAKQHVAAAYAVTRVKSTRRLSSKLEREFDRVLDRIDTIDTAARRCRR